MSGPYKFFLVLHLLAVIGGIGTTVLNGVYGAKAKAAGPMGGAIAKANFDVTMIAEKIIYTIPIFGIILVAISPHDIYDFGQFWIWGSLVLYVIALGVVHSVMVPSSRKMLALGQQMASAQGGPAEGAQMEMLAKRLQAGGMTLNLFVVIFVVLMVWKPGY